QTCLTPLAFRHSCVYDAEPLRVRDYLVFCQCWAIIRGSLADETQIRVVAQGIDKNYAFDVQRQIHYGVASSFQSSLYLNSGFSCTIDKHDLRPGHYTLWLEVASQGHQLYVPLAHSFDVK